MRMGKTDRNSKIRQTERAGHPEPMARWVRAVRTDAWRVFRVLCHRLTVVESGAVIAEYAFLIAFISILAAIGMVLLGDDLQVYFQSLATAIDNSSQPTPDPFAT